MKPTTNHHHEPIISHYRKPTATTTRNLPLFLRYRKHSWVPFSNQKKKVNTQFYPDFEFKYF